MNTRKQQAIMLLAIAFQCLSLPARAIVDIDNATIRDDNPAFEVKFNLSISGKSGNSDTQKSSMGGRLQWAEQNSITFLVFDAERGESSGALDTRANFLHFRHILKRNARVDYELFAQLESNEFNRLSLRQLVGAGLRTSLLSDQSSHAMYLGVGLFRTVEKLEEIAGANDDEVQRNTRVNIYGFNEHRITTSTLIKNTIYYQPNIEGDNDYRLLEKFRMEVDINKSVSAILAFDVSYDSQPPQGVEKRDMSYVTGVQFKY